MNKTMSITKVNTEMCVLLQSGHIISVILFAVVEAGNLIAFDQLCFQPLHVDEEWVAVFKVVIDHHQPITSVRRTGEVMIVLWQHRFNAKP